MMTMKELMENPCQSSPDGKHWEPAQQEPEETLHCHAFNYRQAHKSQAHEFWLELEQFVALKVANAAAKEREACAKVCDSFYLSWIGIQGRYEFMGEGASECAGAIRARGQA